MKADKIVVLEAGKIVGMGKHDDLLFSTPLFTAGFMKPSSDLQRITSATGGVEEV
jgi:ABC-type transport system involved in cytochrome bd biosynthesis fused ATPase/permease subunit